ncbi:hypothetical protein MWU59_12560 [Flavobacteriaceae bacterium F08102]|nr:hypothetical protein [Flavobacteriaceae bacterium F08102]
MIRIYTLCTLFLGISFLSCSTPDADGYNDINQLFKDFPVRLKSNHWEDLEGYVARIVPDQKTFDYMKENNFSYRGIPESTSKTPFLAEYIKTFYLANLLRFRVSLEKKNQLKDLKFVKVEHKGTEMYHKELGIEATETFIKLSSGNEMIRCKLGEMFKINGTWRSFTEPKLGW